MASNRKQEVKKPLWGCALATMLLAAGPVSADVPVELEWHRGTLGALAGASGLQTADLDGDGSLELIASGGPHGYQSNDFWYVAKWNGSALEQIWSSPQMQEEAQALAAADVDSDGDDEVIVVDKNGEISVYDGLEPMLSRTLSTSAQGGIRLQVADVDVDGDLEAVLIDADDLYVIDLITGAQEYLGPGQGGSGLAVGNVDPDPALELVTSKNQGFVIDGITHAPEWTSATAFGSPTRLVDVDGDGIQEIVGLSNPTTVTTYSALSQGVVYTASVAWNYGSMWVLDYDGDGEREIVVADGDVAGSIHSLNASTGAEEEQMSNPRRDVTRMTTGDVDQDGRDELIWGSGFGPFEATRLMVYDPIDDLLQWQSPYVMGPFLAMDHGDLDGDGQAELLYAGTDSQSEEGSGLYLIHDAGDKSLKSSLPAAAGAGWKGARAIRQANVDGDSQAEIFVLTRTLTGSLELRCYDSSTHVLAWQAPAGATDQASGLEVADVDGDGTLEVVALNDSVRIFDALTGTLETQAGAFGEMLRIGNVDGDPALEIVMGTADGFIGILDGQTRSLQAVFPSPQLTSLDLADRDGDALEDILVGDQAGQVRWLSAVDGSVVEDVGLFAPSPVYTDILGLNAHDLNDDGILDYVFSQSFAIWAYDGQTGDFLWTSGPVAVYSGYATIPQGVLVEDFPGQWNSLIVDDVDGDGNIEIWANLSYEGMTMWQIPSEPAGPTCFSDDFDDDILSGDWNQGFLGNADQGGAGEIGGKLRITGDGTTMYAGNDNGFFLYRDDITGDFRMEVDITGFPFNQGAGLYHKAGLMARTDLSVDAPRVILQYVPNFGNTGRPVLQFRYRLTPGGVGDGALGSNLYDIALPVRVALERQGDTFSVFFSTNGGATWRQPRGGSQGSIDIPAMGSSPLLGLDVVSYSASQTLTAEMDNFEVCTP